MTAADNTAVLRYFPLPSLYPRGETNTVTHTLQVADVSFLFEIFPDYPILILSQRVPLRMILQIPTKETLSPNTAGNSNPQPLTAP